MTSEVIVKAHCANTKMAVIDVLQNGDHNYSVLVTDGSEGRATIHDGQTVAVREVVIAEYGQPQKPTVYRSGRDEAELEELLQAKGLNAPRLTPEDIDAAIFGAQFWQPEGTTLTVCAMQLNNGYMVTGESACASIDNFDAEIGKNVAYDNARNKVWMLEGYLLKEYLSIADGQGTQD